jgi:transposase
MMGTQERDFIPHPAISLDDLVPADAFYRRLEETLDLSFVRELVEPMYAPGGRPSIDPVVFFKLQLIMFFEDLRSERQLMQVVADRLSLRWYLGYDLGASLPHHSSLTRIRERYGLRVFQRFFDEIVTRCLDAGLVWGEELMIDATKVEANAARTSLQPRFFVEYHLAQRFRANSGDEEEATELSTSQPEPSMLCHADRPAAVGAALAEANASRHDWIAEAGRQQRELRHPSYHRHADLVMSTSDPDATDLYNPAGGPHLGYLTHYVIDGGKARIILRTLVTPAEVHEPQPAADLLQQTCFRWKLRPKRVVGDSAYGTIEIITALEQAGIRAYLALSDGSARQQPGFTREDFTYDPQHDRYICPEGKRLVRRGTMTAQGFLLYRAGTAICRACPAKARCTPSRLGRAIQRHFHEAYRDRVRGYQRSSDYQKALRKRSVWIEPLFGEAKQWHGLRRFRLRRLERVNIEALLIAAGQNIKRLVAGRRLRPYPGHENRLRGLPGGRLDFAVLFRT